MAGGDDLVAIDAAGQPGDGTEQGSHVVQGTDEVIHAEAPDGGRAGVVGGNGERLGVQVRGLEDEAVGRPVIDERSIVAERLAVAVREHDDGQVTADDRGGRADPQIGTALGPVRSCDGRTVPGFNSRRWSMARRIQPGDRLTPRAHLSM